jgi:hypothetical protein
MCDWTIAAGAAKRRRSRQAVEAIHESSGVDEGRRGCTRKAMACGSRSGYEERER